MDVVRSTRERPLGGTLRRLFVIAAALTASLPLAHADTYQFSFTAGQIINAMSTLSGYQSSDAVYALFLQPACADAASPTCTFSNLTSPIPSPDNPDWVTGTPSNLGSTYGSWGPNGGDAYTYAQFSRDYASTNVAVISANTSFGSTPYVSHADSAGNNTPVTWGTTLSTITEVIPVTDIFSFDLDIASATLPTETLAFTVYASFLGPNGIGGYKDNPQGATFELTLSSPAPEPGTGLLLIAGIGAMLLAAKRRRNLLEGGGSHS